MSTLAEIEMAVTQLPKTQQEKLFVFLADRLRRGASAGLKERRVINLAAYPPLEGLPTDLSVATKERVRALVAKRHAANR